MADAPRRIRCLDTHDLVVEDVSETDLVTCRTQATVDDYRPRRLTLMTTAAAAAAAEATATPTDCVTRRNDTDQLATPMRWETAQTNGVDFDFAAASHIFGHNSTQHCTDTIGNTSAFDSSKQHAHSTAFKTLSTMMP